MSYQLKIKKQKTRDDAGASCNGGDCIVAVSKRKVGRYYIFVYYIKYHQ